MALVQATDGTLLGDSLSGGLFVEDGRAIIGRRDPGAGTGGAEELCEAVTTLARVFYSRTVVSEVPAPSWWRRVTDRTLDIVIASTLLLLLLPLVLGLVVAVRLNTRGPAFFRQVRVGRNGQLFQCLKLRTMVMDAEQRLQTLLASSPELQEEFKATFKLKNDPRITGVGRFLRCTSLDELPQLFNVLRGHMSLVGPRPVIPEETVRYGPHLPTVLRVRPGVTGVWQVSGRNDISYDDRVEMDAAYASSHGLATNLAVLAKTVIVIVHPKGNGAY